MDRRADIFCAVDKAEMDAVRSLVVGLQNTLSGFKFGLEFFIANGAAGIHDMRRLLGDEVRIFLDLKLHDIPNTVAGAMRSAVRCDVDFITVHTSGGTKMMKAAITAAKEEAEKTGCRAPQILGVTVLTSLDEKDLKKLGIEGNAEDQVLKLAKLGVDAGLTGFVCSPQEVEILRQALGPDITLVTPGIRFDTDNAGDQKRVMTPKDAFAAGADYLVMGRAITSAPDKAAENLKTALDT